MEHTLGAAYRPVAMEKDPELECKVMELLEKIRFQIYQREKINARALARTFNLFDENQDKNLSKDELRLLLEHHGMYLATHELDFFIVYFDLDGNGKLSLDEFVKGIHGTMNKRRRAMVEKVFRALDHGDQGYLLIDDLVRRFNPSELPEVLSGEMTAEGRINKMIASLEGARGMGEEIHHQISWGEWLSYYTEHSAGVIDDAEFVWRLERSWGVDEVDHDDERLGRLCALLRAKLEQTATGPAGATAKRQALRRIFKRYDRDESGNITPDEFALVLANYMIHVEEGQLGVVFNHFDQDGSGRIDFMEFIHYLYKDEEEM